MSSQQAAQMSHARNRFLLIGLMISLIAGLAFTPGLPGGFVFDDVPNIENNAAIRMERLDGTSLYTAIATPQMSGNMRTLPTLSFALDYWRAGGADPATFRTTNILIHAITTLVLAWFFRALLLTAGVPPGRTQWTAAALALAWALHPLQVSSVLYAVQRLQTMGTLFLVLALLAYLKARNAQEARQPTRTWWMLTAFLWVLAMSCKEDTVLLPAYTLALELTVLGFRSADADGPRRLRRGYAIATLAGMAAYLFLVAPYFWSTDGYGGEREFSTLERLLTQPRVLCLYLWQILVPLPGHMPFYYDWLQPSRGLLQPWTTLPAIAALLALLATAWRLRMRWPLFSLGVLLFFAAHFITSNVVGVELAFEHRNHFALIGAVLAVGSLLFHLCDKLRLPHSALVAGPVVVLAGLALATASRAHDWRSNLTQAQASTQSAPGSGRAWVSLCAEYLKAGGGPIPDNPNLDKAIAACERGATSAPDMLNSTAMLVALKSLRGDLSAQDWNLFQQRLRTTFMTRDNRRAVQVLMHYSRKGVKLDQQQLLTAISTLTRRIEQTPFQLSSYGYFIMNDMGQPDLALPYFTTAIQAIPADDPFRRQLGRELRQIGRPDLANRIEQADRSKLGGTSVTPNTTSD
ncbi:hypothetical protein [Luteimonas notoginsengisoli]|uniref:Tetratricopeptide repeat protein n=1 Tax=Luteimonas notoginsengisoli TaxID=1578200 RepID=A0ABV7US76_9GAMM